MVLHRGPARSRERTKDVVNKTQKERQTVEVSELEIRPIADEELREVLGMQEVTNTVAGCGGEGEPAPEEPGGWCTWYCPWYPPEE